MVAVAATVVVVTAEAEDILEAEAGVATWEVAEELTSVVAAATWVAVGVRPAGARRPPGRARAGPPSQVADGARHRTSCRTWRR